MNHQKIKKLSGCHCGKLFLSNSYSLELLLFLHEHQKINGVENLYSIIHSRKSKMPSFIRYLSTLEEADCIKKQAVDTKRSMKSIRLSDGFKDRLKLVFDAT